MLSAYVPPKIKVPFDTWDDTAGKTYTVDSSHTGIVIEYCKPIVKRYYGADTEIITIMWHDDKSITFTIFLLGQPPDIQIGNYKFRIYYDSGLLEIRGHDADLLLVVRNLKKLDQDFWITNNGLLTPYGRINTRWFFLLLRRPIIFQMLKILKIDFL